MIKRLLLHNLVWKTGSVAMAVLVWFTANYGLEPEDSSEATRRTFADLPVTVMTDANDRRDYVIDPAAVRATFRGEHERLKILKPHEISVFVNLTGIADAKSFRRRVEVHTPAGIELGWVNPSEVNVRDETARSLAPGNPSETLNP